jgi:nucleoside-diphosphate-sugar epimerase
MGYIGPAVIRHLRRSYPDATLVGVDMGYFSHCLTAVDMLPECRVDVQYFADVRRPLIDEILHGCGAVVHLAAISNDPMGKRFEEVTQQVNYRASVEVARQAKAAGAHAFVFASSCSVYGSAEGGARTEDSPLGPLTAYAHSKMKTEQGLEPLADDQFTVSCLRFATACGMSDRLRLDLVLNDFVASAVASHSITILSDGSPWRPLIHVADMARAIDWAVNRSGKDSGPFLAINVGREDWNYQVRDLAEAVAQAVYGTHIVMTPNAQADKRSYRVSFNKFSSLAPDHQPQMSLESAIAELKHGLECMAFHDTNFRQSSLIRLEVLKRLQEGGWLSSELEWLHRLPPSPIQPCIEEAAIAAG